MMFITGTDLWPRCILMLKCVVLSVHGIDGVYGRDEKIDTGAQCKH